MFDQYKSQLPDLDPNETSEWVEALEDVVDEKRSKSSPLSIEAGLKTLSRAQRRRPGVDPDALYQHHSTPRRAEVSRRPNHGKAYSTDRTLERHGHGSACQQAVSLAWVDTFHRTLRLQVSTKLASTISSEDHKPMVVVTRL